MKMERPILNTNCGYQNSLTRLIHKDKSDDNGD